MSLDFARCLGVRGTKLPLLSTVGPEPLLVVRAVKDIFQKEREKVAVIAPFSKKKKICIKMPRGSGRKFSCHWKKPSQGAFCSLRFSISKQRDGIFLGDHSRGRHLRKQGIKKMIQETLADLRHNKRK